MSKQSSVIHPQPADHGGISASLANRAAMYEAAGAHAAGEICRGAISKLDSIMILTEEVETSVMRELTWAVEFHEKHMRENAGKANRLLEMYENAIDDGLPYEQLNDLWAVYVAFNENARESRREWNNAQAALLAAMN